MVDEVIKAKATISISGLTLTKQAATFTLIDSNVAATYATGVYATTTSVDKLTASKFDPIYARITPTNGIRGHEYSIAVSGVTAHTDDSKIWSSGSLNFSIEPTTAGTMTVTFKNVTTNTTIGTATVTIAEPAVSVGATSLMSVEHYFWEEDVGSNPEKDIALTGISSLKPADNTVLSRYTSHIGKLLYNYTADPSGVYVSGSAGFTASNKTIDTYTFSVIEAYVYDVWEIEAYFNKYTMGAVGYFVRLNGTNLPNTLKVRVMTGGNYGKWQTITKYNTNGNEVIYIGYLRSIDGVAPKELVATYYNPELTGTPPAGNVNADSVIFIAKSDMSFEFKT